jgi:hypothetical protein
MIADSVFEPPRWGLSTENTKNLPLRVAKFWQRFQEDFKTKTREIGEYAYRYLYMRSVTNGE